MYIVHISIIHCEVLGSEILKCIVSTSVKYAAVVRTILHHQCCGMNAVRVQLPWRWEVGRGTGWDMVQRQRLLVRIAVNQVGFSLCQLTYVCLHSHMQVFGTKI